MSFWIEETFVDADAGCLLCEPHEYETFEETKGDLFLSCQKEYGGCVSSVYIDDVYVARKIGWCFQKRVQYDDCEDTFLREVWVIVLEKNTDVDVTRTYHYLPITSI